MNDKGKYWDKAWNVVIGCTKCSPGCLHCWALDMTKRFAKGDLGHQDVLNDQWDDWSGKINCYEGLLDKPLHWKKPCTIFVCNMGDLFHEKVPFEFIDKMVQVIATCPCHKFLMLTKRPERMKIYFDDKRWPETRELHKNLYHGVTVCNQAEADEKIPVLLQIPAAKRWLSIEPMLEPIRLFRTNPCEHKGCFAHRTHPCEGCGYMGGWPAVDWVVVGCESGPNRRPCKSDWIVEIVEQCQAAGIKVYVKQVNIDGKVSHKMSEWPEELRVRDAICCGLATFRSKAKAVGTVRGGESRPE